MMIDSKLAQNGAPPKKPPMQPTRAEIIQTITSAPTDILIEMLSAIPESAISPSLAEKLATPQDDGGYVDSSFATPDFAMLFEAPVEEGKDDLVRFFDDAVMNSMFTPSKATESSIKASPRIKQTSQVKSPKDLKALESQEYAKGGDDYSFLGAYVDDQGGEADVF